jgi:hypothetical protein
VRLASAASLAALAAASLLTGCGAAEPSPPCAGAGACASGSICSAGRCRPGGAVPAWPDTVRILLPPRDVAVVSARGDEGLGDAVALGRADDGDTAILLRFVTSFRDDADVVRAFVVLEPLEGAEPPRTPTRLEVARILEPWSSATVSRGRQPKLAIPTLSAIVPERTPPRVRLEVTDIVRRWPRRAKDDQGIAVLARGDDPVGTVVSTGLARGRGPTLEVYVR